MSDYPFPPEEVAERRETIPAEAGGMQVMSAFRQLPAHGSLTCTWTVILREVLDPLAGNRYRVCRVRQSPARHGGARHWDVVDSEPGGTSLAWPRAALLFAKIVQIEAIPPDDLTHQAD